MNKKGFTLVELLAVIVILALILVLVIPKVVNVKNSSKLSAMESSAKLVASKVEENYQSSEANENLISLRGSCMEMGDLDTDEYALCSYVIDDNEMATITLVGKTGGKFNEIVCENATKVNATCTKKSSLTTTLMAMTAKDAAYVVKDAYQKGNITDTYGDCMTLASLSTTNYKTCEYDIDTNGNVKVSIEGATNSDYEGYACIDATENAATCGEGNVVQPVSFATDSWETIFKALDRNNLSAYNIGDTKCIKLDGFTTTNDNGCLDGEFAIRIANKSTPNECSTEGFSETACGFVLEFADIITTHNMSDTATNVGGWPATSMRTYVNDTIYNALPEELREGIINTTVISGHGSNDSNSGGNWVSTDKLYLLSTVEVWGTADADTLSAIKTRQLDYYKNNNVTLSNNKNFAVKKNSGSASVWWLRAAYSYIHNSFNTVSTDGSRSYNYAGSSNAVSPAFRIG